MREFALSRGNSDGPLIFAGAVVALTSLAAVAQQDPIATRKAVMKANGDEAKIASAMIKGKVPFDLAAAHKVFATFEDSAQKVGTLFPPNSQTGEQTSADPKIWDNMADFESGSMISAKTRSLRTTV